MIISSRKRLSKSKGIQHPPLPFYITYYFDIKINAISIKPEGRIPQGKLTVQKPSLSWVSPS